MLTIQEVIGKRRVARQKPNDEELRRLPDRKAMIYGRVSSPGQVRDSEESIREIAALVDLSPSLALLLREHRTNQELGGKLLGRLPIPDDLVFCNPDGTPLPPNSVTKAFHKLAKSVRISGIRLHDLRHTHATLMLRQGVHPKVVSERLGHSSVAITLDTYSHVLPGIQAAAARHFDEGLQRTREEASVRKVG